MNKEVKHDKNQQKFYVEIDGEEAHLEYDVKKDNVLDYYHTYVPNKLGGQGLGSKIARKALNYAKNNNYKVIPSCSFIKGFIRKHQEYLHLKEDHS